MGNVTCTFTLGNRMECVFGFMVWTFESDKRWQKPLKMAITWTWKSHALYIIFSVLITGLTSRPQSNCAYDSSSDSVSDRMIVGIGHAAPEIARDGLCGGSIQFFLVRTLLILWPAASLWIDPFESMLSRPISREEINFSTILRW